MQLVDEQDHVADRGGLRDDEAKALFVLAAIGRPGEQRHVIEREQTHVSERERYAPGRDALREAFRDGCLAYAGRSDERRVVLAMAQQDVDDARNFLVATAHRLEPVCAGVSREVTGVAAKRAAALRAQQISNHG